jgi:hypothetical protein
VVFGCNWYYISSFDVDSSDGLGVDIVIGFRTRCMGMCGKGEG